jgi:homoserine/homoserine lactone efflux protein
MSYDALLAFFLVSVLATATPGPAILYVLSAGLSRGAHGYGPGVLGILCADLMYFLLSAAGLGTFLLASYHLFVAVKWLGAAYLVWLGLHLLWLAWTGSQSMWFRSTETPTHARWLSGGFKVHAANPKALLYFGSLVPQFIRPADPLLPQLLAIGLVHFLTAATVMLLYGFFAGQVRAFARNPWFARTLNGTSGAMLIAAGAGLASMKRGVE